MLWSCSRIVELLCLTMTLLCQPMLVTTAVIYVLLYMSVELGWPYEREGQRHDSIVLRG